MPWEGVNQFWSTDSGGRGQQRDGGQLEHKAGEWRFKMAFGKLQSCEGLCYTYVYDES